MIIYPVNWCILNLLFPPDWPPPAPTLCSLSNLKQQESSHFKNPNTSRSTQLTPTLVTWLFEMEILSEHESTNADCHALWEQAERSLLLIESATSTTFGCVLYANQGCRNPLWSWITGFEMPLKVVVLCSVNLISVVCLKSSFQFSVVAGAVLNAVSSTVQGCWAMTLTRMANRRSRTNRPVTSLAATTSRGGETSCSDVIILKRWNP